MFELDGQLVDLVREHLALDSVPGLLVRVGDGRCGIADLPAGNTDLVVLDVFLGGDVVSDLATVEFLREIARVLRPDGLYVANVWDGGALGFALRAFASVGAVFRHLVVLGEAGVFLKSRPGNLVIAASAGDLPVAELVDIGKSSGNQFYCLTPAQLAVAAGSAPPLTDADPLTGPVHPVSRWGRGSRFT